MHGESAADLAGALSITRSNTGTETVGNYSGVLVLQRRRPVSDRDRCTTAATLSTSAALLNGVVSGDAVLLQDAGYSASFGDKNVGTGKAVSVSGLSLSGADAGNHTFSQPTGVTGNITPRTLLVTAVSDTKTYDGTTQSSLAPTLSGLLSGDSVSGSAAQSFADPNAGTGKTLTASHGSLVINDGNGGANYVVTLVNNNSGVILPPLAELGGSNRVACLNEDGDIAAATRPELPSCNPGGAEGSRRDPVESGAGQSQTYGHCASGRMSNGLILVNSTGIRLPAGVVP